MSIHRTPRRRPRRVGTVGKVGLGTAAAAALLLVDTTAAFAGGHGPRIDQVQARFVVPAAPAHAGATWLLTVWSGGIKVGSASGTSGVLRVPLAPTPTCQFQADVKMDGTYYAGTRAVVPGCDTTTTSTTSDPTTTTSSTTDPTTTTTTSTTTTTRPPTRPGSGGSPGTGGGSGATSGGPGAATLDSSGGPALAFTGPARGLDILAEIAVASLAGGAALIAWDRRRLRVAARWEERHRSPWG